MGDGLAPAAGWAGWAGWAVGGARDAELSQVKVEEVDNRHLSVQTREPEENFYGFGRLKCTDQTGNEAENSDFGT